MTTMSSSESLKPHYQFVQLSPQQSRKVSDESVDSGYIGSRQHSAVHVLDSRELPAVIKENDREKETSPSTSHKSSSSFSSDEAAVSSKTPTLKFTNFPDYQTASECSTNPSSSDASTPADTKSQLSNHSRQHEGGFQSKSESALHITHEHCPPHSRLADTEVGAISNEMQPSQPSAVQLIGSAIRELLSSNESQSQQNIVQILETAIQEVMSSTDTQSQPNAGCLLDPQPEHIIPSMTDHQEEVLKRAVKKNASKFVEHTHFETLTPFLFAKELMHSDDCEMLANIKTHKAKGNYFYTVILPRKDKFAYRRLYKCLRRETEHLGHRDLVEILDTALKEQPPKSSSDSSPTESNFNSTSPSERDNSSESNLPDSTLSEHKVSSRTSTRLSSDSNCCTIV